MIRSLLALSSLALISIPLFASEFPIKEVPPLYQLHLFQSEVNADHYILLGKDGIYGDAGNWYVVDWNDGEVSSPKLKKESFFWFSGGFDFKYENGKWLYIPVHDLHPGALNESIPAGLIDPNTGREPLKSLKVTREILDQLKLSPMIAPDALEQLKKVEAKERPRPIAKSHRVVLVTVKYTRREGDERDLVKEIKKALEENEERAIYVTEIHGTNDSELMIWAFDQQAPGIVDWIKSTINKDPKVMRGSLDHAPVANPVSDLDAYYKLSSLDRVLHADAIYKRLKAKQTLTPDEADQLAVNIHNYIRNIEHYYRTLTSATYSLDYWVGGAAAKKNYIERFERPLQKMMAAGYEILHRLNRPLARDVIFFGAEEGMIPELAMLNRKINEGGESYFENWLKVLADQITWAERATPEQRAKRRGQNSSGGVLQEFGFLNVTLRDARSGDDQPTYFGDNVNPWPLLVFGTTDSPALRAKFASFIVKMDKHAEIQRELLKSEYDSEIVGSNTLVRILQSMSYTGSRYERSSAMDAKKFSTPLYFRQMIQVVTELLSTARITIKNRATYIALLDAAVGLQRQTQATFGVLPEDRALAEALIRMQRVIQVRLMRAVYHGRNIDKCAEALLPQ